MLKLHLIYAIVLSACCPLFGYAQESSPAQPLELGKPVERELKGGEVHVYGIRIRAGEFAAAVVDQRGIDVDVLLLGPDGKQLAAIDSPNGSHGPEPVYWVGESSGEYLLKIRPLEKEGAGRYEIKLSALRAPTDQDKTRVAADLAVAEGHRLLEQRTGQSAQNSIQQFEVALPLLRSVGDGYQEGVILNKIGTIYVNLGDQQNALAYFNKAIPVWRSIGDKGYLATTLSNIGSVYQELGEKVTALDYFEQALALARESGDRASEAQALQNIAVNYEPTDPRALEPLLKVLPIYRSIGHRRGEALALGNISTWYRYKGEYSKALEYATQSLNIFRELRTPYIAAGTMFDLGLIYSALGEKQKAVDQLEEALAILRKTGHPVGEAETLLEIGRIELDRGDRIAARKRIEAALTIVESVRSKMFSQALRASYFAGAQKYYETYINLLMAEHRQNPGAGYDAQALGVSEQSRARSLLDNLVESKADIRQSVSSTLLDRERSIHKQLNEKAEQQSRQSGSTGPEHAALATDINRLTIEYQNVQAQIKQQSPRYAALTQPEPLKLNAIQKEVLDNDTILLEYALGEKKSYLWAVSKDSINSYELPSRSEIESSVRSVHSALSESKTQPHAEVSRLSQTLLGPVRAQLRNKRILLVADGALQYLPFSILPIGETGHLRPLIASNEIVSVPSASTLVLLRRQEYQSTPQPKALVVVADPVFSLHDPRLKMSAGSGSESMRVPSLSNVVAMSAARDTAVSLNGVIPRLPFSRREAQSILAILPAKDTLQVLDFEANRAAALSPELSQYRIVHFATHGLLNSEHPELSGIVLSLVNEKGEPVDGFLRLNDIYNMNLNADLVVLSACQTALGKEVKGEGLIGLTRGFMYAGSPRVIASLWKVDDVATAEFMKIFYQKMLKENMRPAAALRAAKITMMKQKRWSSPYYWAAFELQGEWR